MRKKTKIPISLVKSARDITDDMMIDALIKSGGIVSAAAALLEKSTGIHIDRTTIQHRLKKNPTIQAARDDATENITDMAELNLIKAIREGNMTAIIFYLKTKGRNRGYIEKREVEANVQYDNPFANLTTEELRKLANDGD